MCILSKRMSILSIHWNVGPFHKIQWLRAHSNLTVGPLLPLDVCITHETKWKHLAKPWFTMAGNKSPFETNIMKDSSGISTLWLTVKDFDWTFEPPFFYWLSDADCHDALPCSAFLRITCVMNTRQKKNPVSELLYKLYMSFLLPNILR